MICLLPGNVIVFILGMHAVFKLSLNFEEHAMHVLINYILFEISTGPNLV
jgi:hypothetical protein